MTGARVFLLTAAAALGVGAAVVDWRPAVSASTLTAAIEADHGYISAPDLARRILTGDGALQIVDLRPRPAFEQLHVAAAMSVAFTELSSMPLPREATIVIYSDGDARAVQAWAVMRGRGYAHVLLLREGIYEWVSRVLEPRLAVDATADERAEFARMQELSRFFGGMPLSGVPRSDVPAGYWTGTPRTRAELTGAARQAIASIRRRGC